jgi:hypothetical protein
MLVGNEDALQMLQRKTGPYNLAGNAIAKLHHLERYEHA